MLLAVVWKMWRCIVLVGRGDGGPCFLGSRCRHLIELRPGLVE